MPRYTTKRITEQGNTVYEYSDAELERREKEKAQRVQKLSESIDQLREQVSKDLDSDDATTRLSALIVAVLDETAGRIGNPKSAEDDEHYGISTLKKEHITFRNDNAYLKYTGKSGVEQSKKVEDSSVIKALKDLAEDKESDESLFECEDGDDTVCVRAEDVNKYLEDYDITAKDIRGYHANELMRQKLEEIHEELPDDDDEKEEQLKKEFDKALKEVAEQIGHEPDTLKNNYLVVGFEDEFKETGKIIEKFDKKARQAEENNRKKMASRIAIMKAQEVYGT